MNTKDKNYKAEDILKTALETGAVLLKNGADVRRVEDTILRICKAYNLRDIEVFSITSLIIITASSQTGKTITQTKRIYNSTMDLTVLEQTNALSREICENPKPISYVQKKLSEICENKKKFKQKKIIGYMLAAGSFSLFFGGNIGDAIASVLITLILFFGNIYILKQNSNRILYTFSISALMGLSAIFLTSIGIGTHKDKIMIGDIMLLVPGMALINSITDMFSGDLMTGTTQITWALLTALSIAGGFIFAFALAGGTLK